MLTETTHEKIYEHILDVEKALERIETKYNATLAENTTLKQQLELLESDYADITYRVVKCPICKHYTKTPHSFDCAVNGTGFNGCKMFKWRGMKDSEVKTP